MKSLNEKIWREEKLESAKSLSTDALFANLTSLTARSATTSYMINVCALPMGLSCGSSGSNPGDVPGMQDQFCGSPGGSTYPGMKIELSVSLLSSSLLKL